jgi:hypothetical protein
MVFAKELFRKICDIIILSFLVLFMGKTPNLGPGSIPMINDVKNVARRRQKRRLEISRFRRKNIFGFPKNWKIIV